MSCRGLHCDGCRGGGGAALVLVVLGASAMGLYAAWPTITATVAAIGAFLLAAAQLVAWVLLGLSSVALGGGSLVLIVRGIRAIQARRPANQRGRRVTRTPAGNTGHPEAPVGQGPQPPARTPIAALPPAQGNEKASLATVIELHHRRDG